MDNADNIIINSAVEFMYVGCGNTSKENRKEKGSFKLVGEM